MNLFEQAALLNFFAMHNPADPSEASVEAQQRLMYEAVNKALLQHQIFNRLVPPELKSPVAQPHTHNGAANGAAANGATAASAAPEPCAVCTTKDEAIAKLKVMLGQAHIQEWILQPEKKDAAFQWELDVKTLLQQIP